MKNNQEIFYGDIIDCLQEKVNEIAEIKYANDICKPKFIVSLLNEKEHKILLTVKHLGFCMTNVVFPDLECNYGYPNLEEQIKWLYNQTM